MEARPFLRFAFRCPHGRAVRVGVTSTGVCLGAFLLYATRVPTAFMSVFIVLKIVVDTIARPKERRAAKDGRKAVGR